MDKLIRVLVTNHPKLMREAVLAAFADQPDVVIVGEVSNEPEHVAPDFRSLSYSKLQEIFG